MTDLRVGDKVLYRDRSYVIRGISPMGATTRRVLLEDPETHELTEAQADDLRPDERGPAADPR